jgi:hypothetical protein
VNIDSDILSHLRRRLIPKTFACKSEGTGEAEEAIDIERHLWLDRLRLLFMETDVHRDMRRTINRYTAEHRLPLSRSRSLLSS